MSAKDLRDLLIGLGLFAAMMFVAFWLGRCTGQADIKNEQIAHTDTVVRTDTVKIPHEKLETQVVTQEVIRYKYVPISVESVPDTVVKHDTIIRVNDGVAVIPISMKTYTDSTTYKAVVSGYDPRLESIEIYQKNTEITKYVKPSRWSIGLQGGMYMTTEGLRPGVGIGVNYSLNDLFRKK